MKRTYTIRVRQVVVETATFDVQADNEAEARAQAEARLESWQDDTALTFHFQSVETDPYISSVTYRGRGEGAAE